MDIYSHITSELENIEHKMETSLEAEDKKVYGLLVPFLKRGGKRIRPALVLLSSGATNGKYADCIDAATIIELFHNFTLIHDDIEDSSDFRRGEPTLHIAHGLPIALNSGDALYTYLWKKLVNLPLKPSKLITLEKLYAESFKRVVDGQGIELSWIRAGRFDIGEKEYLDMIAGKTSALLGLSCETGAICSGATKSIRKKLRNYGESLGLAFQIHDDILNLTGDFNKYKKEIGGDISEGKRTLIVVHCLSRASEQERKRLIAILSIHTKNQTEVKEAIDILMRNGSIDYAKKFEEKIIQKTKAQLNKLPDSRDKTSLLAIADYVVRREE